MKKSQELLKKAGDQLRQAAVVRDSQDAILMFDLTGRIMAWNPSAQRLFGWNEAEALAMNLRDIVPEELRENELDKILRIIRDDIPGPWSTKRIAKDGQTVEVRLTASALIDEAGRFYAVATSERA